MRNPGSKMHTYGAATPLPEEWQLSGYIQVQEASPIDNYPPVSILISPFSQVSVNILFILSSADRLFEPNSIINHY
jgi:hypothetical protein